MTREFLHAIPETIRREAAAAHGVNYDKMARTAWPLCWYCSRTATTYCTEKLCEPWITFPGELRRYDLIQDVPTMEWCMVEAVEERLISTPTVPWLNDQVVIVTIHGRHGLIERRLRPLLPVLEIRNSPCARPACDTHARDLGDGEHFRCLRHWYEDAPAPPEETKLAMEWAGLLETSIELKKKERRK